MQECNSEFGVASINAGCACADPAKLSALWLAARQCIGTFRVLYVAEIDQGKVGAPEVEFDEFVMYRSYPGRGSRAMAFLVCKSLRSQVTVWWQGRAGHCSFRGLASDFPCDLSVVGWHGGHGEALWESLSDLRDASLRARGSTQVVVVGDSNIDHSQWCAVPEPPLPFLVGPRGDSDELEHRAFAAIAEALRLTVREPSFVKDAPGGAWALYCSLFPVTRIPQGQKAFTCRPSMLDMMCVPATVDDIGISWAAAPADHGLVFCELPVTKAKLKVVRSSWHCGGEDTVLLWIEVLSLGMACQRSFAPCVMPLLTKDIVGRGELHGYQLKHACCLPEPLVPARKLPDWLRRKLLGRLPDVPGRCWQAVVYVRMSSVEVW